MTASGFPVADPVDSYWQLPPHRLASHRTTAELPTSADYVVIGSGISGATVARKLLARNNVDSGSGSGSGSSPSVLMLEARTAASAASGRNGGHCRTGWWARLKRHADQYGEDEAIRIDNLEQANVRAIATFVHDHAVDCDFRDVQTTELFRTQAPFDRILEAFRYRQELSQRRPEAGLATDQKVLQGREAEEMFGVPGLVGASAYPAHTQNPYLLVCKMLELAIAEGLNLQTTTLVREVTQQPGDGQQWLVRTERGTVRAKHVVLATNGHTTALHPALLATAFLRPARSQVTAVRTISRDAVSHVPALAASCGLADHNAGDYMFVRAAGLEGAGDMVYGGGQHVTMGYGCTDDSRVNPEIADYLHGAPAGYFGRDIWADDRDDGEVVRDWTGIVCYTPDSFPLVGPVPEQPGLWISAGMNGHGMALAYKCAEALVDMMVGGSEPEWFPKAFRADRAFKQNAA